MRQIYGNQPQFFKHNARQTTIHSEMAQRRKRRYTKCLFSDSCSFLDYKIQSLVSKIPGQIVLGTEEARKELQFRVDKSHSQGISILSALALDLG